MRHVFLALLIVCGTTSFVHAELFPDSGPPGATVTIGGAAFGEFVSTAENRVDFNGAPALIQLWEPDLVMVKVPLGAKSGDVTIAGPQGTTVAGRFAIQQVKIPSWSRRGGTGIGAHDRGERISAIRRGRVIPIPCSV